MVVNDSLKRNLVLKQLYEFDEYGHDLSDSIETSSIELTKNVGLRTA